MECACYFLKRVPLGVSPSYRRRWRMNRETDAAPLAWIIRNPASRNPSPVYALAGDTGGAAGFVPGEINIFTPTSTMTTAKTRVRVSLPSDFT